jgi:DNA-binding transcriptional ArsR family regulator
MEPTIRYGRVFFALADATRRQILDDLHDRDGRRPGDMKAKFPMSRQAFLKHLQVLEEAGLITAHRTGGETVFYVNRTTLRLVQSGWLAKFTEITAGVDCG